MAAHSQFNDRNKVETNEELASLIRLRLADDEPLSVEHSLLVHRSCPGILEQDYANNSLCKILGDQFNIHIVSAKQKIRVVSASEELAELLNVDRGDRYTFHSELRD